MTGYDPAPIGRSYDANPRGFSVLVVAVCMGTWTVFLPITFAHNSWIYSWDSAAYIETAQSLLAGRGLMQRVIDGLGQNIWELTSLWPPGYSLIIALGGMAGFPLTTGCLVVSVMAAALSIVLLVIVSLRLFHWSIALPLVLTTVIMQPFLPGLTLEGKK